MKGRVGFVLSETPGLSDVLVQGPTLQLAMPGDRVRVRLYSTKTGERRTGEIVDVVDRARHTVVGEFRMASGVALLAVEDTDRLLHLMKLPSPPPKPGDLVVARVTRWPKINVPAAGEVVEVLGPRSAMGVDLKTLIRKHELPEAFPAEVDAAADGFGTDVPPDTYDARRTFFTERVVTIDGADAKDFDDAVSIQKNANGGWTVWVHIADVSHYVTEGSALDKEAHRRGTSVYFPGRVLPMLPFALSANLCSLRPHEIRLTLTCEMDISADGHVGSYKIYESAIKSHRRFTYEEVEKVLKGHPHDVSPELAADVHEMDRVARALRAVRTRRGSLDFDFPEPLISVDHEGRPIKIERKERLESHRLIEDLMLIANETVARWMSSGPFL